MKTHFTQADVGKTFATSQDGVTATLKEYDDEDDTFIVLLSDYKDTLWFNSDGTLYGINDEILELIEVDSVPIIEPSKEILSQETPSEADFLRKEIEELKEQLRTCDRHRAEDAWSALGEINSWRDKYNALKASHGADLRTAVEMARELISFEEYDNDWLYEPDEIIEKITHSPAK
jgi:hypothetical protein